MIYVIIGPVYVKKGDYTKYDNALKIGYSSDKKKTYKGRFSAYNTENPTNEILFKIMGGTRRDEKNLHKYFSKYQKKFEDNDTREWFEYCPEILDFFKTHSTIESIRAKIKPSLIKRSGKKYKEKISESFPIVWPYIVSIKEITRKLDYSLLEDYSNSSSDSFCEDWIKSYYPKDAVDILNYYRSIQSKITSDMAEFIIRLRETNKGYLNKRLKELCENDEFTEDEKKIIAQQVSEKFDKFYNQLGPEKCKAAGYNTTDLLKEIEFMLSKESVLSKFCSQFLVGNKYSNQDAKKRIKQIYEDLNFERTPKAVDLLDFFEVKKVQIMEDGKKVHGYEILGLKK